MDSNIPTHDNSHFQPTPDVDGMRKAIEAMNNPSSVPKSPDTEGMKAILESYYRANGNTESLVETTHEAPVISGEYFVIQDLVESNGSSKKRFKVVDENDNEMVNDLVFKESAESISKYLTRGSKKYSKPVLEVIELEEQYARHQLEANANRKHYERCLELNEDDASEVFKSRYNKARAEGIAVKESIKAVRNSIKD